MSDRRAPSFAESTHDGQTVSYYDAILLAIPVPLAFSIPLSLATALSATTTILVGIVPTLALIVHALFVRTPA